MALQLPPHSLGLHTLEGASCHSENTQVALESSHGKRLRSPTNSEHHVTNHVNEPLGSGSSSLSQVFARLQLTSHYNLSRDSKLEPLIQTVQESLTQRNWLQVPYTALQFSTGLRSFVSLLHHTVMVILKPKASQNPFLPPLGPSTQEILSDIAPLETKQCQCRKEKPVQFKTHISSNSCLVYTRVLTFSELCFMYI